MAKYFHIAHGLRGCYMPDNVYVIKADTRRQLKEALAYEADGYRDAGFIGGSKRVVASVAARVWREAHKPNPTVYDFVVPLAPEHSRDNYAFGVFASVATRRDYLESQSEES